MNLHLDKNAFRVLLEDVHKRTGYRADVLEKDYYVVMFLKELSNFQSEGLPAYFKGGTALYKALKMTNRFSEDIDLSVDTRGCSRTQGDKRLEKASKRYASLPRDPELGFSHRSEIMAVYEYEPVTAYDADDELQRFGKLKVEATSFTISEPTEAMEVSAMLYEYATPEQKKILKERYAVYPFFVLTITLERIFVDKLFAAEAYVRASGEGHRAFEAAKHIYDLAVLERHPSILSLEKNETLMKQLLNIRMEEEKERHDGIPYVAPNQFRFFEDAAQDELVRNAYSTMQRQYVLREQDRISFDDAMASLQRTADRLYENRAWKNACPPKKRDDRDER